jgi:hypothetical protein
MDTFQDFLTLTATVIEYFFFAYVAIAFMVYSLQSPSVGKQPHGAVNSQTTWKRSVDSSPSFAVVAS